MSSTDHLFRAKVVVLGASNATKGISLIVETAERMIGSPLDVHTAIGHGRSYGQTSFLVGRSIQGTLNCGLWDALESGKSDAAANATDVTEVPIYALLTDVGNDIMYCVDPPRIIDWVGECIERLQKLGARLVMTGMPMAVVDRIGRKRYMFFRTLFFPKNPNSLEETVERVRFVQAGLKELAADRGVPFVDQKSEWYGLDPIHLTQGARCGAWAEIMSHWFDRPPSPLPVARRSTRRFMAIRTRLPEHWWLFNRIDIGMAQPSIRLPGGTRVSMY